MVLIDTTIIQYELMYLQGNGRKSFQFTSIQYKENPLTIGILKHNC